MTLNCSISQLTNTNSDMTRSLLLGQLRQGQNGNQLLSILDSIVADVEQQGINECAAHYAAISMPTLTEIAF